MPVYGRLNIDDVKNIPTINELATEAVDIEKVETLTFTFEVATEGAFNALPKALHPPGPPYCSLTLRKHHDSPVGPFTTAELRLHTRATGLYMGYVLGGFADSKKAVEWLRGCYGAPMKLASIALEKRHYGFEARVEAGSTLILDATQTAPGYISGSDVLYIANLNLATLEGEKRLISEEFEYTTGEARRGAAAYKVRDLGAFGAPGLRVTNELPSTHTAGTWRYTRVRYTLDPNSPALGGARKVKRKQAIEP